MEQDKPQQWICQPMFANRWYPLWPMYLVPCVGSKRRWSRGMVAVQLAYLVPPMEVHAVSRVGV